MQRLNWTRKNERKKQRKRDGNKCGMRKVEQYDAMNGDQNS
jgi:ribosome assembly protein YihI (activator of Der GTPase)